MAHKRWFEKHPRIAITIFIAIVYLFLDWMMAALFNNTDNNSFRTRHFYYHHGLLPNKSAKASWNGIPYSMYTNSLACRDREVREVKTEVQNRRVLFIGDSHTEGVGLNYEETFTGMLQKRTENSGLEIINGSAVSYSPKIYFLKTKYLFDIDKLRVNEVFVCVDISDLQNELVYENFKPSEPGTLEICWFRIKSFIMIHSFTLRQFKKILKHYELERFLKKAVLFDSYRTNAPWHTDALSLYAGFFSGFNDNILLANPKFHGVGEWIYDPEFKKLAEKGLKLGQENISRLKALCDEHNIPLTLSVHPWQEQIVRKDTSDMFVESWRNFCNVNKIRFVNLYPDFIYPKTSIIFGNDYFLPNDNHWNKAGNMIVANKFIQYLKP